LISGQLRTSPLYRIAKLCLKNLSGITIAQWAIVVTPHGPQKFFLDH
jgi:hypothetical protein